MYHYHTGFIITIQGFYLWVETTRNLRLIPHSKINQSNLSHEQAKKETTIINSTDTKKNF